MKKIIFTSLIAVFALSTFAQGNSQKNKNKSQSSVSKKEKDDDRYEERGNKDRRNNGGRYEDRNDRYEDRDNRDRRNNDDRYEDRNNKGGKYSKNTPRKVGDAFRNDFPNATNVRWTKDRGTWTATFGGGGLFGGTNTATYKANGQRVSNNGIFGRRN